MSQPQDRQDFAGPSFAGACSRIGDGVVLVNAVFQAATREMSLFHQIIY
jgi:hypothetical protein